MRQVNWNNSLLLKGDVAQKVTKLKTREGGGGGWPEALAGQWLFRHKTRKPSFQACFWLTVLLNGALLQGWHARL